MSDVNAAFPALYKAHPAPYIGPQVISATAQGFQTGLVLNFAYRFWRDDFFAAKRWVHAVLTVVTLLVLYACSDLSLS